jgi:hypothetical protein
MGKRSKKIRQARVSDADDDEDKVSSTTPKNVSTSKTNVQSDHDPEDNVQSDHDPEDNWPPGWSDTKKRQISPAQWPLNSKQWSLFEKLLKKMGKEKNPTPGSIAKMIGAAGIWDVSHPKWKIEGRTGIANDFHPDKVLLLIGDSRKHGVKINDSFKEELLNLATAAYQGEVIDNVLSEGTDVAQSAIAATKTKRGMKFRRLCNISETQRKRYLVRAIRGNLP